jgi:hypothetical protein
MNLTTVGHAGHSVSTATKAMFDLETQIAHKRAFVSALFEREPRCRAILAGHSVGAHMVVEVMRALPADKILRGVLLFPTLLHIGSTPNGVRLTPVFDYLRTPLWIAMHAIVQLPLFLQRWVLRMGAGSSADEDGVSSLMSIVHPDVLANALLMAKHEMREIGALDREHFARIASKLVLYFGSSDGWVADNHASMFESDFPAAQVVRCTEGHGHAFVLNRASSLRLGALVAQWALQASEARRDDFIFPSGDPAATDKH